MINTTCLFYYIHCHENSLCLIEVCNEKKKNNNLVDGVLPKSLCVSYFMQFIINQPNIYINSNQPHCGAFQKTKIPPILSHAIQTLKHTTILGFSVLALGPQLF